MDFLVLLGFALKRKRGEGGRGWGVFKRGEVGKGEKNEGA